MNKLKLILLSLLGGMDVFIRIATPIFLIWVWLSIFGIPNHWTSKAFIIIAIGSSIFRAIKLWKGID